MTEPLLPQHILLLEASAISDEVAVARGYRSITVKADLKRLGFGDSQLRVPTLLIPVRNFAGGIATYQSRPDEPRLVNGKVVKYETPGGSRMVVDVPPATRPALGDPHIPLFVTEAPRKADAAVSKGLACVAVIGVWNWRGTNGLGGKTALADWESIALNDRVVYIVFDSDVATNKHVRAALTRLREFLKSRGAHVRIVLLPPGPGGIKMGLDDFFAAGHSVGDLMAVVTDDISPSPSDDRAESPYRSNGSGLYYLRPIRDDVVEVPLTNFDARIVADIVEDDGAEQQRVFEIEAALHGRAKTIRVSARTFASMGWPTEHLGAGAVVFPHQGDQGRTAIQLLSGLPPTLTVFTSMGWREIDGQEVYLHAGGAIGPDGPVPGVEVRLDEPLARFRLPDPPVGHELVRSVRATLDLLKVARDPISFALLATIYRAPLGDSDLSGHLTGPTGVFKTELAALAQAHYGSGLDARHLPGSWSSTANSNEDLLFRAKDAVIVIDDFAPGGSVHDVSRANREADRVMRAQGNSSGRQRMRADGTLRPPRPPRGLALSTGEDVPRGASLLARIVVIEVGPGDVSVAELTRCQADAAAGSYAGAMAGFVQWLAGKGAPGRRELRVAMADDMVGLVKQDTRHRRTPRNLTSLASGLFAFLTFATEADAIGVEEHARLRTRGVAALLAVANAQVVNQASEDPVSRFIDLLRSAVASGKAHVAGRDGDELSQPEKWGWRREERSSGPYAESWRASGSRIGWLEGDDLYLEPHASYAAAQAIARDEGEAISLQPRTIHKRLSQAGYLRSTEANRDHLTVRRMLEGSRRPVLHVSLSILEAAQQAQPDQPDDGVVDSGPVTRAGSEPEEGATGPSTSAVTAHDKQNSGATGPDGPDGLFPDEVEPGPAANVAGGPDGDVSGRPRPRRASCRVRRPSGNDPVFTVQCLDYPAHQFHHRRVGDRFICDICEAVPS